MMPTDLAVRLTDFLGSYLPAQRGASPNTIKAYRDAFTLLLRYCRDHRDAKPETLTLSDVDVPCIVGFLEHLERERECGARTRNQRLAAIHAFFRYVQTEEPGQLAHCQRILAIPMRRPAHQPVSYLSVDDVAALLAQPDQGTPAGRRDAALLSVLYDTGARVQELADIRLRDLRLDPPPHVRLTGKGRKTRIVPLLPACTDLIAAYIDEHSLDRVDRQGGPLFFNRRGEALSRFGIRYILQKYIEMTRRHRPGLPPSVSPHTLRHTKAMHLLQAGNPSIIIRDILGHADIKTTTVYARADIEAKRAALEKAATNSPTSTAPSWKSKPGLMDWLRDL
jgi:site-specific recombinase XerD